VSCLIYCYDECRYPECRYAEGRYAECRGAIKTACLGENWLNEKQPKIAQVGKFSPIWSHCSQYTFFRKLQRLETFLIFFSCYVNPMVVI